MRHCLYIAALAVFALFQPLGAARAENAAFFSDIPDLPLMPGLAEDPDAAVVFDQPDGRIVEAEASGHTLTAAGVSAFYARILPQLGWRGSGPYARDGENLVLTAEDTPDGVLVSVRLAPR